MFDNFSYMNKDQQPKVDKIDEEETPIIGVVPNEEIKRKQIELIAASEKQHFMEKENKTVSKSPNIIKKQSVQTSDDDNMSVEELK